MKRHDPQPLADERLSLTQYLDYQRATILLKVDGLNQAQLAQRIPSSGLTLAGLVKHLALVEDDWIQVRFCGRPEMEPWASAPWDDDPDWEFHTAVTDDPCELRALYRAACDRSNLTIAAANLDDIAAVPSRTGEQRNLRWIVMHLIEETARHAGHADILREAIDGTVGE